MNSLKINEFVKYLNDFETKHAPSTLWYEGNKELLSKGARVSVVGSRKPSREGRIRARAFAKELVELGITVVSGLAEGIDTIAHSTAIQFGGNTIAVLGTPLNEVYPKKNAQLLDDIKRSHLAISQFAIGRPFQPQNFPRRNRTMALISDATVIIEASEKSGTRHQGWEALRIGRSLFILESVVKDKDLSWPKEMMQYGAQMITRENIKDALLDLPRYTGELELAF